MSSKPVGFWVICRFYYKWLSAQKEYVLIFVGDFKFEFVFLNFTVFLVLIVFFGF